MAEQWGGAGAGAAAYPLSTEVSIHSRVRTRVRKELYQDIEPQSSNTMA